MKRIGVLSVQGAFHEHINMLRRTGVHPVPVRLPMDIKGLDGLVIPGGESTAITKLIRDFKLEESLLKLISNGAPVLGTCAGMIVLAKRIDGNNRGPLAVIDIEVKRNAFGRQVDSFEMDLDVPVIGPPLFHAIFIRAPVIERVGANVEIIAKLPGDEIVACREGNIVCTSFHPELTSDLRFHDYFLNLNQDSISIDTASVR